MPDWAEYKVLAYKVPTSRMIEIAIWSYEGYPAKEEELMNGLASKDDKERVMWMRKGVIDALIYLKKKSLIPFRTFSQQLLPNKSSGWLLAFCSSAPVPREDFAEEFYVANVRPFDKLKKILRFGRIIGIDGHPCWYIPDEAHKDEDIYRER